jgi:RNase H-fold protein (predicted Holliday junction resolvase)
MNPLGSSLHFGQSFGGPGEKVVGLSSGQNLPAFVTAAASVNQNSHKNPSQIIKSVKLSQIEAESKRLVLAFESRLTKEINWALNTLAIFSCNTSQNFTLENQPYLLDSMANYLVFCI